MFQLIFSVARTVAVVAVPVGLFLTAGAVSGPNGADELAAQAARFAERVYDRVAEDPTPYLSALGVFVALFLYHKARGWSTRDAVAAAASRSTTVVVQQPAPAQPQASDQVRSALNRLASVELERKVEELVKETSVVSADIKKVQSELAYAQRELSDAQGVYDLAKKEFEALHDRLTSLSETKQAYEDSVTKLKAEIAALRVHT